MKENFDFYDILYGGCIMDRKLWKELCEEFNKWCDYRDVENMTYAEARVYIENMPV